MSTDIAIHSDILVYWTGRDIESECGTSEWWQEGYPRDWNRDRQILAPPYVQRLKNILKFGLWMTPQSPPSVAPEGYADAPCACFTALKISESRQHARQFGRLGIGVKRPFLFERGGRPMVYYGNTAGGSWAKNDHLLSTCAASDDTHLLHYFKPMNKGPRLDYGFYSETEWRIVFDGREHKHHGAPRIVDPKDSRNAASHAFFNGLAEDQKGKCQYLIPLDGWLSMIIYPNIEVKTTAVEDMEVRELLKMIKLSPESSGIKREKRNPPVEIDLELCRNL